MPTARRPFQRLPFDEIPDAPLRPHDDAKAKGRSLAMRSRPFGEMRVHYRELGSGPPLLLVHGLMTSSYSWRYVIGALAKRFRVIAPDLPGAGRSDAPDAASYSAESLATWIGEFQRELGVRGGAVVGNSLGGYLCMRLALRDPAAMSRLVNIHSPAYPASRYHALHAALAVPGVKRALARFIRRDALRWVWRNVHYHDESLKSREELREYGEPLASAAGARAFVRWLDEAMAPEGFASFWREMESRAGSPFPVPLHLVYARTDPLVPPIHGVRLQALVPEARFTWIDESSHFAHVDTPGAVLDAIAPFLGEGEAVSQSIS